MFKNIEFRIIIKIFVLKRKKELCNWSTPITKSKTAIYKFSFGTEQKSKKTFLLTYRKMGFEFVRGFQFFDLLSN